MKGKAGDRQEKNKRLRTKKPVDRPDNAQSYAVALNDQGVSVSLRMREIVKLFGRQLSAKLDAYGITIGQWRFLRVLWERDGRSQKEIAEALGFTPGATVFAITILERDDLAVRRRSSEDSRISKVFLTDRGRALEKQLLPYAHESQIAALRDFDSAEIDLLISLLARIRDNLLFELGKPKSSALPATSKARKPAAPKEKIK